MPDKIPMTPAGHAALSEEYRHRTAEERPRIVRAHAEADASKGRIAISSPIARAMIGKSEGDSFEVAAPGGSRSYDILELRYV